MTTLLTALLGSFRAMLGVARRPFPLRFRALPCNTPQRAPAPALLHPALRNAAAALLQPRAPQPKIPLCFSPPSSCPLCHFYAASHLPFSPPPS
jgi:hypothetical protein